MELFLKIHPFSHLPKRTLSYFGSDLINNNPYLWKSCACIFTIWPSYVQPLSIIEKIALNFSENEGGGSMADWEFFRKFIRYGFLTPPSVYKVIEKDHLKLQLRPGQHKNISLPTSKKLTTSAYLPACLPGNAQTMHLCHLERLNNKFPQKSENANPLNCKTLCQ